MTEEAAKLIPVVDALSASDKIALAQYIWDSLNGAPDPEIEKAWIDEINRRVEEMESGKDPGIPAEEVFRKLREKYG